VRRWNNASVQAVAGSHAHAYSQDRQCKTVGDQPTFTNNK